MSAKIKKWVRFNFFYIDGEKKRDKISECMQDNQNAGEVNSRV